jgi:signal transduction histidine kinase/CheY-like chemotaxis protein
MNGRIPTVLAILGLALAYWGMAHLLSALAVTPGFAAPIWPPAGIALGALVTWGLRVWPGVLIGSFVFNLATTTALGDTIAPFWALAVPVGIALGATLQSLLGAVLLRRYIGEPSGLEEPRQIVHFLVIAGPVSSLLNATLSVALLVGSGVIGLDQSAINWLTWWAGDTIGVLVFAPLFLCVFGEPKHAWKPRRWTVALPLMLCLAVITGLFGVLQNWEEKQSQLELAQDAGALARYITRELEQHLLLDDAAFRRSGEHGLYLRLFTGASSRENTLLYSSPGAEKYANDKNAKRHVTEIQLGGRSWDAEFIPSSAYLARHGGREAWYRHALIVGSLLVISLIGTLLLIFTGRERHIALITDAVVRVSRGDRSVRLPISHHSPLRMLETGFNEMAAKVEENEVQLERRVEQATAGLRAKKEESEAATLAKSRLLSYASHDLRQPLHALQLFVAHLTQLPLNYETARIVSDVEGSVGMLTELLDGLLDLSRLDSGLIQPTPQPVPVSALWQRVQGEFAEYAAAKQLELRFRASPLWIVTDIQLLHRILLNLVSNAIRYTSRGGVLVTCRRAGEHARLQVWDTGAGISPEHRPEIFKEFVQFENSQNDDSKGLGLGLAIVERSAQILGHRLRVRSTPGRGSCFSVDVPIADAVMLVTVPAEDPSVTDRFSFAAFIALVVEDDAPARRALVDLLRSWGCVVLEARTAEDAQQLLANGCRPDVIASDFRLPGGQNGIDLVRLARNALGYDVAAFVISGDTHSEVMVAATAAGLPLLHKPVQPARLRRLLHLLFQEVKKTSL